MASELGKRYRRGWALRNCSVVIPECRVVALVGPNGAGKSTFMGLVTGLLGATTGDIEVFGQRPNGKGLHPAVSYLAQQKPLYPQFTVAESLSMGRHTNPTWDQGYAEDLVARANVPLHAKVGTLSGGQRTRVALAMALGKRPRLLLLDEPLADLDPLARQVTLQTLLEESRQHRITVLLSSHVLAELEEVCDHLVLLAKGRVHLAGDVTGLIAAHRVLTGPSTAPQPVRPADLVDDSSSNGGRLLVVKGQTGVHHAEWQQHRPRLGDLVLAYMRNAEAEVAA